MTLIKSISGIRGTIGSHPGEALTPIDIVRFTAAFAEFIDKTTTRNNRLMVVGRDARISGGMVCDIVVGTLMAMGFDVVNIGLASTPTTEMAVVGEEACGGLILTASHNPAQWNALKMLNEHGEFLNAEEGARVLEIADSKDYTFAPVDKLGREFVNTTYNRRHIEQVLDLDLVDVDAIRKANFKVAVDAVNSVGGVVIPELLIALGVTNIVELNCVPTGRFAHLPEPIPENLTDISRLVRDSDADLGLVVDPDVDRLVIIMEDGRMFGEENTLVSVADYVLSHTPGPTVSNLTLRDITIQHGCTYSASAVGEVNVTTEMKRTGAVIGGEGNGGVIYPPLHYGRDALVGAALFLTMLAKSERKVSELRRKYPYYSIFKTKVELSPSLDIDALFETVKERFKDEQITDIDGVKIDFENSWVHLRKSNTEPIIRVYAEAHTEFEAKKLGNSVKDIILEMVK